ncbi:MAG: FAD-dependent oxidoreductase [Pseudomonadota bacterium]
MTTASRPTVVLVGAGHAHLHVAEQGRRFAEAGIDLVLIDPGRFWYSSMATGLLGGEYEPEEDSLDPHALITARGGRSIRDKAVAVDRRARTVALAGGGVQPYDVLSLNVGSHVPRHLVVEGTPHVWAAKPITALLDLRRTLEAAWEDDAEARPRAVVVGLGLGGAETALNLDALARRREARIAVTVLGGGAPRTRTTRRLIALLEERGVTVRPDATVARVAAGEIALEGDERLAFDHVVLATGLSAHPLVGALGLAHDAQAGLFVSPTLNAPDDPRVFAAGDCAAIVGAPRPKVGVFGVRAAPILCDNLLTAAKDGPEPDSLRPYRPQTRWLWVANLGDGTGLGAWGGEVGTAPGARLRPGVLWRGRSALWLKETIDARFMARYRAAPSHSEAR